VQPKFAVGALFRLSRVSNGWLEIGSLSSFLKKWPDGLDTVDFEVFLFSDLVFFSYLHLLWAFSLGWLEGFNLRSGNFSGRSMAKKI